uniref:Uncharacterized protein n=1 Tax=Arundo donax TaxID=35708 RepID=A0A0A9H8J6_ARUDO
MLFHDNCTKDRTGRDVNIMYSNR